MARADEIMALIHSHFTNDKDRFLTVSRQIAVRKKQSGQTRVADDIEHLIYTYAKSKNSGFRRLNNANQTPHGKESKFPLVDVHWPVLDSNDVVLEPSLLGQVERVVEEQSQRNMLKECGLSPAARMLFYGLPGTGKTLTANLVASALDYPLLYTRFDAIIEMYLGQTATNLRRLFDFASSEPCVLFFDEFDAIGRSRGSKDDVGEMRRVVNTFLQLMDHCGDETVIVAATNHESLIDPALWRRFDVVCHFELPNLKAIDRLLALRLDGAPMKLSSTSPLGGFAFPEVAQKFLGCSHSDITKVCNNARKSMLLGEKPSLSKADLFEELENFKNGRPSPPPDANPNQ